MNTFTISCINKPVRIWNKFLELEKKDDTLKLIGQHKNKIMHRKFKYWYMCKSEKTYNHIELGE